MNRSMSMSPLSTNPNHPNLNLRQWNIIIKRQALEGRFQEALQTYVRMQEEGFHGDNFTFPILLKAATHLSSLRMGTTLHGQTMKSGFSNHTFVQTALMGMYTVLGVVENGRQLFDRMSHKDVIGCNCMLHAYASWGRMDEATLLFNSMTVKDQVTFNIMLSGCASMGKIDYAEELFDTIPVRDVVSWNSMISTYVKAGKIVLARSVFDQMPEKNTVSWNSIITGYLQGECYEEVMDLFDRMKVERFEPNHITLASALSACAHMGSLREGIQIHSYARELRLCSNPHVVSSLIDMYAKCGSVERALEVFYRSPNKDTYCWNSMISGLAAHGFGSDCIKLFMEMKSCGVEPDDITFIGILSGCSHAGLWKEGCRIFEQMESEYGVSPKSEHYACLVDLLGRAGFIRQAYEVTTCMPFEPGLSVLGALLSACTIHGELEIGDLVAQLIEARVDQLSDGEYMMLANLYARCGRHKEASRWRRKMNDEGVIKTAGCSVIQVNGRAYSFLAGDTT